MVARLTRKFVGHVRDLWPGTAIAVPVGLVLWPLFRLATDEIRWDYLAILLVPPILAFATERTKRLFVGVVPLILTAYLYDAMRFVQNVGVSTDRVHVCDLRAIEMRFFGITLDGHPATVHDWIRLHTVPALDLYFSIPYATFIFAYVGMALFLWTRDERALLRFGWYFFFLNLVAFVTYHLYPAAPPWYFHEYGCKVDLSAQASEGPVLARVDAWLGVGFFRGMYRRASDVFGAVPSLHCAYPLLIFLEGFRHLRALGRTVTAVFFLSMCSAAVYLDHHWIVDVLLGVSYGLVVYAGVGLASAFIAKRRREPARALEDRSDRDAVVSSIREIVRPPTDRFPPPSPRPARR